MKKLLLLLSVGVIATNVQAQKLENTSLVISTPVASADYQEVAKKTTLEDMRKLTPWKYENRAAGKTTISGSRTFNYVELLALLNTVQSGYPYLWSTGDATSYFTGGYDTSAFMGFGSVLHPWYSIFNDPSGLDYAGKVAIQNYTPYVVDTVAIYGVYVQNVNKMNPAIPDTLRVALTYGDGSNGSDLDITNWFGGNIKANYGVDTITVADVQYDFNARVAEGTTRVIKNIPLTQAVIDDTLANGQNRFAIPYGQNVPAGNLVAVTATVITGDPAYSPYDTVFHGTQRSSNPAEFSMFRPWIFEQNDNAYATYEAGNFNLGLGMLNIQDTGSNFYDRYLNQFFWTKESGSEFPYIDFVVTCGNCPPVSVANVHNYVQGHSASPNPATNTVTVKFGLEYADDATITVRNMVGQVLATQKLENVLYGDAKFDVSKFANGLYIYTIQTKDLQQSGRFSIAH